MAHAGMSICAAASNISPMRLAPSSIEYSVWACRCTKLNLRRSQAGRDRVNYSDVFRTPPEQARARSSTEVAEKLVGDASTAAPRGIGPREPPGVEEGPAQPQSAAELTRCPVGGVSDDR